MSTTVTKFVTKFVLDSYTALMLLNRPDWQCGMTTIQQASGNYAETLELVCNCWTESFPLLANLILSYDSKEARSQNQRPSPEGGLHSTSTSSLCWAEQLSSALEYSVEGRSTSGRNPGQVEVQIETGMLLDILRPTVLVFRAEF
jgi:hypothetical protein